MYLDLQPSLVSTRFLIKLLHIILPGFFSGYDVELRFSVQSVYWNILQILIVAYGPLSSEWVDSLNLTLKWASLKMKPRKCLAVQDTAAHQFKGGDRYIDPNLIGKFSGR